ncbi:MAG: CDP-alcohol phosphatidyltransferase family protein [Acidimicrobiia bacterium]
MSKEPPDSPSPSGGGLGRGLTVPNLISVARLAAVPIFIWLLVVRRDALGAALLLAALGASDWLDGVLARRLGQVTELGKFLDPLADRAAIAAALLGGWAAGVVPPALAAALGLREGLVALATVWLAIRRLPKLEVRYLGKVATTFLYVAFPAFYLAAAGVSPPAFEAIGWAAGVAGGVLYYLVLVQYAGDLRRRLA